MKLLIKQMQGDDWKKDLQLPAKDSRIKTEVCLTRFDFVLYVLGCDTHQGKRV